MQVQKQFSKMGHLTRSIETIFFYTNDVRSDGAQQRRWQATFPGSSKNWRGFERGERSRALDSTIDSLLRYIRGYTVLENIALDLCSYTASFAHYKKAR